MQISTLYVVDVSINIGSLDSSEFMNSVSYKTSLFLFFGNIVKYKGIKILFCDIYVDTITVKEAIYINRVCVEAVACDTEILCNLLYHITLLES